MKGFQTLILTALLTCPLSFADQKDANLPELFGQLKSASSPQQAVMIETEIWKTWYKRDDADGGENMQAAVDAMSSGRYTIALNLLNSLVDQQPDFCLLYTSPSPRDRG